eukprot:TRINITY_DN9592_c0_g1_i1.p1 TRINITY_DN9592_c0_g1~~TRINITY_DN9592_c0_g1_i1.p1  ORF type:complete len:561 (+),score=157.48 TRINITY_DN9592_c0_g1_i1:89-1684(+)
MRPTAGASCGPTRSQPAAYSTELSSLRERLAAALELQQIGWQKYWQEVSHRGYLEGLLTRRGYAVERLERELAASQKEVRELRTANTHLGVRLTDAGATVEQLRADLAQAAASASAAARQHREELRAGESVRTGQSLMLCAARASEPLIRAEQSDRDTVCECALTELHRLAVEARSTAPRRRVGFAQKVGIAALRGTPLESGADLPATVGGAAPLLPAGCQPPAPAPGPSPVDVADMDPDEVPAPPGPVPRLHEPRERVGVAAAAAQALLDRETHFRCAFQRSVSEEFAAAFDQFQGASSGGELPAGGAQEPRPRPAPPESPRGAHAGPERRVDPSDGKLYTLADFLEFYGPDDGQLAWEAAVHAGDEEGAWESGSDPDVVGHTMVFAPKPPQQSPAQAMLRVKSIAFCIGSYGTGGRVRGQKDMFCGTNREAALAFIKVHLAWSDLWKGAKLNAVALRSEVCAARRELGTFLQHPLTVRSEHLSAAAELHRAALGDVYLAVTKAAQDAAATCNREVKKAGGIFTSLRAST